MHLLARIPPSFRSRVARRVFLLCALCALVPTLIIGIAVYTRMARFESNAATARLQDQAKRFGLLLQDRLTGAEQDLIEAAELHLQGRWSAATPPRSDRVSAWTFTAVESAPDPGRAAQLLANAPVRVLEMSLQSVRQGSSATARLRMTVAAPDGRALIVSGMVRPEFLWQSDLIEVPGSRLCVESGGQKFACIGELDETQELRAVTWELYLRPRYGAESWVVTASQPLRHAEAGMEDVRRSFPLLAGIALAMALLFGSFEVRRTHQPLAELLTAIRGMARGQFARVNLPSRHNEYGRIARALLASFERMDRAILDRPAIATVVDEMLPKLARMLDCEQVALGLIDTSGGGVLHWPAVDKSKAVHRSTCRNVEEQRLLLQRLNVDLQWHEVPVRLGGADRGRLYCGVRAGSVMPRSVQRQARGLARRVAVALRNEEREQLLLRQAYYDELTQLPNRRLLQDRVQQALREAAAEHGSVAFLYLDLDRFKMLNDSLGHRCGDELLMQMAGRLSAAIAPGDTVARLGGDEFVVLLRQADAAAARLQAERMLTDLRESIIVGGVTIAPHASVGIAVYPADGVDFDTLLRNSDAAMYRGKAAGGGRVVFFEERMNEQASRRLRLESRLRQALAGGEGLSLAYQPKVLLQDRSLHSVEALLRWNDAELGEVLPMEFVAAAEESGLIHELGNFALEQAIAFGRRCLDASVPIGHVAVNVSMLQLRNADLVDFLQRQLRVRRLPPGMLQLEITESAVMQDVAMVSSLLQRVRELGVRIAVDDFGTGYSSLAVLQKLPVDMLKIDRAFIADIARSTQSLELVRAMLAVSRALGLEAVAEGVETEEQERLLMLNGCDYAQGYRYGRPLNERAVIRRVASWHWPESGDRVSTLQAG
jgi:diguanylate cyclase